MLLLLARSHSAEDKREFCRGLFWGDGIAVNTWNMPTESEGHGTWLLFSFGGYFQPLNKKQQKS